MPEGVFSPRRRARRKTCRRAVALAAAAVTSLTGTLRTHAATLYWDGDGVGAVGGGPGLWNITLPRWANSPAGSTYTTFASGDTATFNGPGATVDITTGIAGKIDVQSGNYFFQATGSGSFTWTGSVPAINVEAGASAEMRLATITAFVPPTKTGAGAFGFSGTLTNTSQVNLNAGTIYYARSGATIGAGKSLVMSGGSTLNLGKFSDTLGTLSGAGTIVLGAINDATNVNQSNPSAIWGSTLTVNADGTTSTFSGNILDDGAVSATLAPFSGGHLVKSGNGTLTLSGTGSSFHGSVLVNAGKLIVSGGSAIPDYAPVRVAAGTTFQLAANESVGSIGNITADANNNTGITGVVDVGARTLTIGGDNLVNEFSGALVGSAAGTIVKVGSGKQFINALPAGISTYAGKYVIQGGVLGFADQARMGPTPAAPTPDYLTLDGGTLAASMQSAAATQALSANRGITVSANGGGLYFNNPTSPQTWNIDAPIRGTGQLARSGTGFINLRGDNSQFSGNWLLTDGIMNLGSGGSLYGTTAGLGNMVAGTASWDISQARLQFNTNASISGGSQNYSIAAGAGATFSYGPGVSLGILRNGNNTMTVTVGDPNSVSSTLIRKPNGTMIINASNGPLTLGASTGEKLVFSGNVPTVTTNGGADTIVPGMILTTSDSSTEAYFATHDNQFGLGVQVAGVSSKTDINTANNNDVFQADHTTTNTLTASRSVYALKIGTIGTAASLALAGGTLTVGAGPSTDPAVVVINDKCQVTAVGGGTVDFANHEGIIASFGTNTWNGVITGSQGLTKMGYGQLVLGSTATLTYTGPTRIEHGQLTLGANNQLPAGTDLIFVGAPSTTATVNPTLNINGRLLSVNSVNSINNGSIAGPGGPVIAIGSNGLLKITGSGFSSYNGQITGGSGTSTVWNTGTGTLQLGISDALLSDRPTTMVYNKLFNTGGGTVILPTSQDLAVYPLAPASLVNDSFFLDNGSTFRFQGMPAPGVGGDTTSLGATLVVNASLRGFRLGTNGGTIQVDQPYQQISLAGTGGVNASGTLTKTGAGALLLPSSLTSGQMKLRVLGGVATLQADLSLGTAPASLQTNNITLDNGGALDTLQAGATTQMTLGANRGITIGPGGGQIRQGLGIMNVAGPLTGTGPLRITSIGSNTAVSRSFSGISDGTLGGSAGPYTGAVTLATDTAVYVNAKNALGTGAITNDPTTPVIFGTSSPTGVLLANSFSVQPGRPWDWAVFNNVGDLTLSGVVLGAGNMYKGLNGSSSGMLELSSSGNSFSGDLTISQGTLVPVVDGSLGSTSSRLVIDSGGQLILRGNVNLLSPKPLFISDGVPNVGAVPSTSVNNASGNNTFAGPLTLLGTTAISVATAASLTLTDDLLGGGGATLGKEGNGLLTVKNIRTGGLIIDAGNIKVTPTGGAAGGVSHVGTLTINSGAKLDLTDNKLITSNAIGTLGSGNTYTGVAGLIQSGRNGGNWSGSTGIVTSQTAATTSNFTSIGVATAADAQSIAATATSTWAGQTVSGSDTLVMYTYGGDANLDGKINVDDYGRIDFNVNLGTSGWSNGDFNYDGKINVDDYGIIDFNVGIQGAAFFTSANASPPLGLFAENALSTVPEPRSAVAVGVLLMTCAARRRRRCIDVPRETFP